MRWNWTDFLNYALSQKKGQDIQKLFGKNLSIDRTLQHRFFLHRFAAISSFFKSRNRCSNSRIDRPASRKLINDPLGQTQRSAHKDHYWIYFVSRDFWKAGTDVRMRCVKLVINIGRDCGPAEWINRPGRKLIIIIIISFMQVCVMMTWSSSSTLWCLKK